MSRPGCRERDDANYELERKFREMKDILQAHGLWQVDLFDRYAHDMSDPEEFEDEDEFDHRARLEDEGEEPSAWDEEPEDDSSDAEWRDPTRVERIEPNPHHVHPMGPRRAGREFKRYARAAASGEPFGSDIARYAAARQIKGESPIDRA